MEIQYYDPKNGPDGRNIDVAEYGNNVMDFIASEDKVYGRKTKPRNQEPNMFEILTWKDEKTEPWDFTVKNKEVLESNPLNKIKYKINKAQTTWATESMDQYRKFAYSPGKKDPVFIDMSEPTKARSPKSARLIPPEKEELEKAKKKNAIYVDKIDPKFSTIAQENYAIKNLGNWEDVKRELEAREKTKSGDIVGIPEKARINQDIERKKILREQKVEEDRLKELEEEKLRLEEEEEKMIKEAEKYKAEYGTKYSTKKIKKAKVLDPVNEKERLQRRMDRIKHLNQTTRWLPNSAFYTYFGKPPFENYGRANINPTVGGTIYGNYLRTHNINPERGDNSPQYKQVFERAELFSTKYGPGMPEPPRKCKEEFRLSDNQVKVLLKRNPLEPEEFKSKSIKIVKPDLLNAMRFASEENTPEPSVDGGEKEKKDLSKSLKALQKTTKVLRAASAKKVEDSDKMKKKQLEEERKLKASQEASKASILKKEPTGDKYLETKMVLDQNYQRTKGKTVPENPEMIIKESRPISVAIQPKATQEKTKVTKTTTVVGANGVTKAPEDVYIEKDTVEEFAVRKPKKEEYVDYEIPNPKGSVKVIRESEYINNAPEVIKPRRDIPIEDIMEAPTVRQDTHEAVLSKVNADMEAGLELDPMNPPKNYLFTLSAKETNPKYYKNVPAVWLNRIPYAGSKNPKNDDMKSIFNYDQ